MSTTVTSLIVAAGAGTRLRGEVPKGFRLLGGAPLFLHSLIAFDGAVSVGSHVLVVPEGREDAARDAVGGGIQKPLRIVSGGARRQDSVLRGLEAASTMDNGPPGAAPGAGEAPGAGRAPGGNRRRAAAQTPPGEPARIIAVHAARIVAVHDAARPFVSPNLIERTVAAARDSGAAVPVLEVSDTVREIRADGGPPTLLDRSRLRSAQTPQTARLDWLLESYARAEAEGTVITDEGTALELAGFPFSLVEGSSSNLKITTPEDFEMAQAIASARRGPTALRIGFGEDRHPRAPERPFVLAGVILDERNGPAGHSDGDPLCHALVDALLGAAGEGSIGDHFPDTDPRWSGARGLDLLGRAVRILADRGWRIVNVDAVVIADTPRLSPHAAEIRGRLAAVLGVDAARVSVKGKRAEGLGFEGEGGGVSCRAIVLIEAGG